MKGGRWLISVLSILALGAAGGAALAADEGAASAASKPEAAAAAGPGPANAPTATAGDTPAPTTAAQPAEKSQPAASGEEKQDSATVPIAVPASPPPSLQTLVDERRDQLRARREAMFDAYSGRYGYMPPWLAQYDAAMDQYRDAMRRLYRQQRDYSRMRHNSWMDAMCPWSRAQRDWSEQRSYLTQMDQLDRQQYWDSYLYRRPFGAFGPIPW
jgi:hypothetical protein